MTVLKVLSELSPVLLDARGGVEGQLDQKRRKMGNGGVEAEEEREGRVFSVIARSLLPRSVAFCFTSIWLRGCTSLTVIAIDDNRGKWTALI